ncbi:MAG: hypothetical protein ABH805_00265 [Candidatus Nealsonbacteria bacterium]
MIILNGRSKKVKDWFRSHVYAMYNFRKPFEERKRTSDSEEIKRLDSLIEKASKEVDVHEKYGKYLKIKESEILAFNRAIVEEVARSRDRSVKSIIELLIRENS